MTVGEGLPQVLAETEGAAALVSRADGRILSANAACEALFGYGPGALAGRHLSELSFAPAEWPEERAHTIAREIAATGAWSGETEGLRADGTRFGCIVSLSGTGDEWLAEFSPA